VAILALSAAIAAVDETQKAEAFPKMSKGPALVVKEIQHPDTALSLAIDDKQKRVAAEDRPFVYYFWWGATPDGRLFHDLTTWRAFLQTVNSEAPIVLPRPIPGSNLRLWAIDIRDARWTRAGFANVAKFDKVFTEPNVDHALAEKMRRLSGIGQDVKTFHVEAVVPGPWFLRQIMDVDGVVTTAYYDLLYSVERFGADGVVQPIVAAPVATVIPAEPQKPQSRPWPGGVFSGDGKHYAAGEFNWIPKAEFDAWEKDLAAWKKLKDDAAAKPAKEVFPPAKPIAAKVVKDFPEDLKQFEDRWGTTANRAFLDSQKIFVNNGEIVSGSKNDPKGSYVSYQRRVIRFQDGPFNNGGMNMSTQDFLRTSGRKNPLNFPLESSLGQLEEDAGEHLSALPNGFQAALLTGAAGAGRKRVEFGDTRLVHSSLDPSDVTIRVSFSCYICHAKQDGVLAPSKKDYGETLSRGIENFIQGKQNQLTVRTFFLDWDWKLDIGRVAFKRGLSRATEWPDAPGWSGQQFSEATISFRDWYDAPLTLNQFAAEIGYDKITTMILLLIDGSADAANLFFDDAVARTVADDDLIPRVQLIAAAAKIGADPDELYEKFYPQLFQQAAKQVKGK